jgi:hypothetical protein
MKFSFLTGVVIVLTAVPLATAQPAARETATVSWQYYLGGTAVGTAVPPAGDKVNVRCSVISSDADGAWVCLYVDPVPKSTLPDGKDADTCRPLGKDGKPFKLTNPALLPDSDTTQVVAFRSGSLEGTYKLVVKKDGDISFQVVRPLFAGDTSMSGAASVCWYVSKKK